MDGLCWWTKIMTNNKEKENVTSMRNWAGEHPFVLQRKWGLDTWRLLGWTFWPNYFSTLTFFCLQSFFIALNLFLIEFKIYLLFSIYCIFIQIIYTMHIVLKILLLTFIHDEAFNEGMPNLFRHPMRFLFSLLFSKDATISWTQSGSRTSLSRASVPSVI